MNHEELARAFVRHFAAADLDGLRALLHPLLKVRGPLVETDTAEEYLDILLADRLEKAEARIRHVGVGADSVSVFYDYVKPSSSLSVAQLFRFRDDRISETDVVFNVQGVSRGIAPGDPTGG